MMTFDNGAGWMPDPANPKLERYWDGSAWTELTQNAPRKAANGGGTRVALWGVVVVLVAAGGAVAWFIGRGGHDVAQAEADLVTKAPEQANTAAMTVDAHTLAVDVQTAVLDGDGALPTVAFANGSYLVTGADGAVQTVRASEGVTQAGITGTSQTDFCVWIMGQGGATVHASAGGSAASGGC